MSSYRLGCLGDLPSPARRGERLALESPASTSSPSRRTPASASSTDPTLDLTGSGVTCLVRDVLALLHTMMNVPRGQLYQYQA